MATQIATLKKVAEAFEKSDLRPLFDIIAENIVWKSGSTTERPFRFGGTYTGRLGIMEITAQIFSKYTFRQFEPKEIVSSGDVIWGLFQVDGEYRPSERQIGKPFQIEIAIRWRMQGGKIVEHQSFFDTYALLRQHAEKAEL